MYYKCEYDSKKDINPVQPGLCIDLQSAVDNHVVLDTGVELECNHIESPDAISGIVRDNFQAMDAMKRLQGRASKVGATLVPQVSTPMGA